MDLKLKTRRADVELMFLRAIVYGQGGAGKTRFIGTFNEDPRTAPILVIDAAGNPITIRNNNPPPVVWTVNSLGDLDLAFSFLVQGQPAKHRFREAAKLPEHLVFASVAVDTITEVQNIKNAELTGASDRSLLSSGRAMQIQDWGESLRFMVHMTRLFYALPMHVIFAAQERYEERRAAPFLQGQSGDLVPSYAELMGRMMRRGVKNVKTDEEEIHTVCVWESAKAIVKNQVAPLTLGEYMIDPHVTKVLDAVERQVATQQAGAPPDGA